MSKWAYALATDALVFGCFYLWQVEHLEAAHRFLTFILWTFAVLYLVAGLFGKEMKAKRSGLYIAVSHITSMAVIGLMVWTGMVALPIAYFLGWIFVNGKIKDGKEARCE
jgi:thiosulfate reductase cytochrome b subunit